MKNNPPRKGNATKDAAIRELSQRVVEAQKQSDAAKARVRVLKTEAKQARKIFKEAKKDAKDLRRIVKGLKKELAQASRVVAKRPKKKSVPVVKETAKSQGNLPLVPPAAKLIGEISPDEPREDMPGGSSTT